MIEIKVTEPLDIAKDFIDTVRQYDDVNKCKKYAKITSHRQLQDS